MWAMGGMLLTLNALAWLCALWLFHSRPALLATASLAYALGLRHAVDADHISAIDNVTRKLMHDGRRPIAAGFFFSLGHSTVVVALTVAIACGTGALQRVFPALQSTGGTMGTVISAAFLYLIALMNLAVLAQVVRAVAALRHGTPLNERAIEELLVQRGLIARFCGPLLALIQHAWQMYPLGLLFGLGFDTATEVGLLGIAGLEAAKGMPMASILVFPLLFTAGMSLIDTADGIFMVGAYGWALAAPARKLHYNLAVTIVSIAIAIIVGTMEFAGLFNAKMAAVNFGAIGALIIAIFAGMWALSMVAHRARLPQGRLAGE